MWFKNLRADIKAAKENDPAARNAFEIWLTYSGVHALSWHRVAHFFYKIKLISNIYILLFYFSSLHVILISK